MGVGVGPVGFGVEQQALIWVMGRRGDAIREMERTLGETLPRSRRFLRESGGIPPIPRRRRADHLTLVEREEISRGIAAGLSARAIAGRIGRPSSTVSREIARNGGRDSYRAVVADAAAFERARRPKPSKPATNTELRGVVAASWTTIGHRNRSPSGCGRSFAKTWRCGSLMNRSTAICICPRGKCLMPACSTVCAPIVRSACNAGAPTRSLNTLATRSASNVTSPQDSWCSVLLDSFCQPNLFCVINHSSDCLPAGLQVDCLSAYTGHYEDADNVLRIRWCSAATAKDRGC